MTGTPLQNLLLITTMSLITCAVSNPAQAHDTEGNLSAQAAESGTDVYSIVCYNDPESSQQPSHYLSLAIRNNTKTGGAVSAIVYKKTDAGALSKSTTDSRGGDYNASREISLAGGEGEYLAFVHHVSNTPQSYLLQYHCQDAQNQHTGTQIQTLQNE